MCAFLKNIYTSRYIGRWAAFVAILGGVLVTAVAQAPKAPYALFDQAVLTGSGNTITATRIPVVTATGVVVYENATLMFNVDANGGLTLASGSPQISQAPTLLTSTFKAGTYVGPPTTFTGKAIITVSGPGVTDGGATMWTLSSGTGANPQTYPSSATWYVGPIANNPFAARITKAGLTSTAFSYGVGGNQATNGVDWEQNTLIGVSQVGNTLTIISFSTYGQNDFNVPQDQITYTLSPTP